MKRLLPRAVAFVVVGFIITLVVAIRCANVRPTVDTPADPGPTELTEMWERYGTGAKTTQMIYGSGGHAWGVRTVYIGPEPPPGDSDFDTGWCLQVGWPAYCLEGGMLTTVAPAKFQERHEPRQIWYAENGSLVQRAGIWRIPLRVLWPGIIVNALVYAVAAWAIHGCWRRVRQRARLDARLCPNCKYDLRGATTSNAVTCPECSAVIPASRLDRPRQVLRLWMLPIALPLLVVAAMFFLGAFDWHWIRFQLHHIEPIITPTGVLTMAIVWLWLFCIAMAAYRDRSPRQQFAIASAVSLLLAITSYSSVYAIVVRCLA